MHSNATYRGRANILKRPNRLNVRSGSIAGPPPHLSGVAGGGAAGRGDPDGKRQHTVAEIAEAVGVHRTTVPDYLNKEG